MSESRDWWMHLSIEDWGFLAKLIQKLEAEEAATLLRIITLLVAEKRESKP